MKKKIASLILAIMLLLGITPIAANANEYSPIDFALAQEIGLPDSYLLVKSLPYNETGYFSEGLCAFDSNPQDYSASLIGYTDATGKVVIEPRFSSAEPFSDGLAFVRETGSNQGGYIDVTGRYILPPIFDYGYGFESGKTIVYLDNYYYIINKQGMLSKPYKYVEFDEYIEHYICLSDATTDVLDENYNIIETFEYEMSGWYSYDIYTWGNDIFLLLNSEIGSVIFDYHTGEIILSIAKYRYPYFGYGMFVVDDYENNNTSVYDLDGDLKFNLSGDVFYEDDLFLARDYSTSSTCVYDIDGNLISTLAGDVFYQYGMFFSYDYENNTTCVYDIDGSLKAYIEDYVYYDNGFLVYPNHYEGGARVYSLDGTLLININYMLEMFILSNNTIYVLESDKNVYDVVDIEDITYNWYFYEDGKKQPTTMIVECQLSDEFYKVIDIGINSFLFDGNNLEDFMGKFSGHYGIMNKNGELVIPTEYVNAFLYEIEGEEMLIAHKDDTVFIFDTSGTLISKLEGVAVSYEYQSSDYLEIEYTDLRRGYIDAHGNDRFSFFYPGAWLSSMDKQGNANLYINDNYYTAINIANADLQIPPYEPLAPVIFERAKGFAEDHTVFLMADSYKLFKYNSVHMLDEYALSKPLISDDRTIVPIRMLAECFYDISVYWDGDAQRVEIAHENRRIYLDINSKIAYINDFDFTTNEFIDTQMEMDVPATIINDRTYIPLRAVSEALGLDVYWDEDTGIIGVGTVNAIPSDKQVADILWGFNQGVANIDDLSRLDASLATQPYLDYTAQVMLGMYLENSTTAKRIINYTNTIPAYEALISGTKDLILVTEPSPEILELAAANGVELEMIPFSKEGFVFLVNAQNPIEGLTQQQLRDIYQGKILNWNEVGGPDLPILAYQRNESSGSQTIMENVFMKGLTMTEPIMETIHTMSGLIDVVAEFNESINGGLGYSVYYYASDMYYSPDIKLLAVDGIIPTTESIRDDSYPVIVNYYAVKRRDDNSDSTKRLLDFILSDDGQACVNASGLVSIR